ncbi:TPA: DUF536 domain-containing protein [Streptococcus suis]|nr:DUF536 domain-containing protein [Streptococcus suis]
MAKTVKKIAEELGYSKTYIMQTIKANNLQSKLQTNGNKFLIDKKLESSLKRFLSKKTENKESEQIANNSQTVHEEHLADLRAQIELLKQQIEIKDRQIEEKDKQLDQQQQLTLQAMKDKEVLQLELESQKEQIEQDKKVTKKWWFFGR